MAPSGASEAGRCRQCDAHGLGLLGRELELGLAADHLLGVDARLVAMVDAREHDARALIVEQRDRDRLLPGELVVGVVANERAMRDRAAHRRFDRGQPAVEPQRDVVDVEAERFEGVVQAGGVCDEVLLAALAEHEHLRAPQAPLADEQPGAAQQRDHGNERCCEGDDSLRVGQRGEHQHKLAAWPAGEPTWRRRRGTCPCCFRDSSRRAPFRLPLRPSSPRPAGFRSRGCRRSPSCPVRSFRSRERP